MADWPDTAELAQVLDVENVTDWETTFDRVLAAAIAKVKSDVGNWDEDVDEPDESLSQAALRMAELMALRPEAARGTENDPTYSRLLFGHRRSFGIA
jgi:hypothetical protein